MKKKLLFVLFAVLTLAVGATAATSSVIERTGKSIKKERTAPARQVAKADADKSPTVYGWLRYVEHAPSDQQYGVCRFNAGDPSTVDVLFPFDAEHQACAGAAANGVYYVYRYTPGDYAAPVDFGTVNLTTGAFTKIADYSRLNALFADMTFDYSTQTMYALANVGSSTVSTLVTVNLTNGDVQNVATLAEKFVALACSYDGQLYAIKGDDGYLYKINKTNGDLESIGYTFEEPAEYFQSMEFDHSTETLYWAANTIYEEGFLTVVNIANGNSERTGTISENAQVVGLHIPFVRTADKAPAAVEGLTVTPAAEGALSATLSWTNPTQTYDKKGNTTITRVDIFRDNSLAGSVTDAAPGAQSSWTDANVPTSGRHEYKVFAVNAEGNGEPAEQTAYIGHDTPVAPTGATVSKIDDTTLKVEWTAPTAGQNGGWIDQASLRYRVKRLTDGSMVAENLTATSCTDTVDKLDTYSYEIEAYTADGNGGKAKTNGVAAGPAITVPYTCSFKTDGDFGLWTVIDANNDYYTWERETTLAAAKYYANEDYETSADDWLISSPIALNAGVQYRLRFNAKSYDESYPEHVAVYLGQGKTVEAMTTKLGDFKVATYDMQQYEVTFPAIAADGKLSLGEIWRDVYKVTVSKPGFTTFAAEHDATKGETATVNAVLDEYRVDPFGLEVSKTSTAGQRKFVWNTPNYLFDDFEGHEAFAVNSPGTIGWTYIDDSHTATIPIDGVNYPNAGAEMAFLVFNPYETDPVLGVINEGIRPHSGKQFLASFAKENSSVYNNDFIISPELSFAKDFTFKFFAKSFNEDYGREKMNAGYSTTGKAADNFTWLNGENPVELHMGEWTEYRYTVPAEAKYVAINCVSDYLLFMMVDDVFVGYELPDGVDPDNIRGDLKFEVYLDGNKVAEQAERSFTFDKLQNGTHRAGVKALFHTEASPLVETEFVVTDGSAVSVVANGSNRVYPNPTTGILNIDGAYDRVDVLNVAGAVVARFGNDSTIDIAGNPEGVYIVRVVSGENVTTTKVILKK